MSDHVGKTVFVRTKTHLAIGKVTIGIYALDVISYTFLYPIFYQLKNLKINNLQYTIGTKYIPICTLSFL